MSIERRVVDWIESRFGLKATVLRPVPEYSVNPLYWLGALTVIAFLLQVVTGLLMLIYYVPTTTEAYSSTLYIMNSVPLGSLLETVHLYGAYSMILLAFLHMFRGYFASVQKSPREMMWVIGMAMGFIVLGFGLTGYLLTWTIVSKSATDVSIGMLSFLPAQIGPALTFLLAGVGNNASELARFFDLHIVVLPAALLTLLGIKLWMFETHGAAEPVTGQGSAKDVPWFPNVMLYFAILGGAFISLVIIASVLFPVALPPEFTPAAASNYVPQPEWYFLWVYQMLKFSAFDSSSCAFYYCFQNIYLALGIVTVVALALIFLPFIDRSHSRNPAYRPLYVTLGLIFIAELVVLTVWGYLTPGLGIPNYDALIVTGGTALSVALMVAMTYRARRALRGIQSAVPPVRAMTLPFTHRRLTALFLLPLGVGSVVFANLVGSMQTPSPDYVMAVLDLTVLAVAFYSMVRILKVVVRVSSGVKPR